MKAFIIAMLILIPVMPGAGGTEMSGPLFFNGGRSIQVADSRKAGSGNDNITIVLPADEDINDESVEAEEKPADENDAWKAGFELESNFNTKDWMLGFGFGMQHMSGISLLLRFQIRPLTNSVFAEKSPGVYRQYNERRMVLGLSAGWDYVIIDPFGIYITAGYGVSFAYFRGSYDNAETIVTPMPGGGFFVKPWESAAFRCGYEYIRTPDYPDHHINISAVFMF